MRNLKSSDSIKYGDMRAWLVCLEPEQDPKYKLSLERKMEQLWLRSEKSGWAYGNFVTHLIEVLIVLRHRSRAEETRDAAIRE
jgi:hypothetical protein